MSINEPNRTEALVDRMKGTAKQVAGAVTGNDDLRREGELHHDRAEALADAADLEADAAREQAAAELAEQERAITVERQRLAAEATAEARAAQVDRDRAAEEQRIAEDTRQREAAVEKDEASQLAGAARVEHLAEAERVESEQHAAELEDRAARAKAAAAALDDASEEIA